MNIELVNEIQDKLAQSANDITDIKKELTKLKLDKAITIKAERKIRPGTACKVTYNDSGLVTNSLKLEPSDIPTLPMSKVTGLYEALSNLAPKAELTNIYNELHSIYDTSVPVKTGTKINVDKRGLVTDVSNLLPSDIPELPISKIEGLQTVLDNLQAYVPNAVSEDNFHTNAGTACKVIWDTKGRIINSSNIRIEDLPKSIVDRINALETSSHSMAVSADIERIDSILANKIDKVKSAESGIFTKVVVNSDGLVTKGSQLTKADIPQLTIEDIPNLTQELANKASKDDIANIDSRVSQLVYRFNNQPSNDNIPVLGAVTQEQVTGLKQELTKVESMLSKLILQPDMSQVLAEINSIKDEVTTLSGRLSVLESRI